MIKILIVDDEKNIRLALKQCLLAEKYEVETAVNGLEGYEKIMAEDFDAVLLDMKMPGLTGIEVLQKVRSEGKKVSIIMMTAYGTIEKAVEAMKLGAIDFLSKPFAPEEIRMIIKDVLSREELSEEVVATYHEMVQYAKKSILSGDYEKAREFLGKAILKNTEAPEPHNLLGIIFEFYGKVSEAQKHYRAALALEPTFRPAQQNLERTAQFIYTQHGMNLGDGNDEEE
ncbi:sigma-54-dependent transcriptional regulator [Clostridium formicaceticum]|uniref:Stage 0 sporulation protein A homolog n=1 Tax=Clostridium formicaceticum TaxID=1497 RepID=A0AAC9WH56_9CLOT|nr:response regulator [Clostridium formicaceticum]AOY77951.1 response regulator [Clostridium formicaceticum]ARE88573.1 Sporulation initiation phosphotransferase F [Clostridium formicaceticum]